LLPHNLQNDSEHKKSVNKMQMIRKLFRMTQVAVEFTSVVVSWMKAGVQSSGLFTLHLE